MTYRFAGKAFKWLCEWYISQVNEETGRAVSTSYNDDGFGNLIVAEADKIRRFVYGTGVL